MTRARIEAARRLLAEAPGEALDRLAALSARLLGAAHAQVAICTDEQVPRDAGGAGAAAPRTTLAARDVGRRAEPPGHRRGRRLPRRRRSRPPARCVGVLCVYDAEPFAWTEHDRRRPARARRRRSRPSSSAARSPPSSRPARSRLDLGFAAADIGSFDWDLVTNALHWDDRLMELFGYTRDDVRRRTSTRSSARVHPDDRARVEAAIARAIDGCGDYEADYRVVHDDGTMRWVAARGRVLCDADGRARPRMLGAAYDTTAVHSAAERLGRVLETMSTAFLTLDLNWRFTYVNGAAERIFGRGRDELVGKRSGTLYPELVGTETQRRYGQALETGGPVSFEQYHPPLDAWFDVRATPSEDGLSVYFHDITDRVRAEREREEATGRLQILSAASARLAGTLEVDELLAILSDVVLNGFGERRRDRARGADHPRRSKERETTRRGPRLPGRARGGRR